MTWAPAYATVDELRRYLRLPTSGDVGEAAADADNAAVYSPAIEAVSRLIDRATGRQFGAVTLVARYYTAYWDPHRSAYVVTVDDIGDATGLVVASDLDLTLAFATVSTVTATLPANAIAKGKVITRLVLDTGTALEGSTKVTAAFGWAAVPDTILSATLLQASRIAKRRDAPFGVAGSPEMGSEIRLLSKLDPDVALMVGVYRRYF